MKITKKEVLEAIKFEPLYVGNGWILEKPTRLDVGSKAPAKKANCTVCLVGGVLRRKLVKKGFTIGGVYNAITEYFGFPGMTKNGADFVNSRGTLSEARETAKSLIREGHFLAALSTLFETHAKRGRVTLETRRAVASDVRKMFPKEFNVSIDERKAA